MREFVELFAFFLFGVLCLSSYTSFASRSHWTSRRDFLGQKYAGYMMSGYFLGLYVAGIVVFWRSPVALAAMSLVCLIHLALQTNSLLRKQNPPGDPLGESAVWVVAASAVVSAIAAGLYAL